MPAIARLVPFVAAVLLAACQSAPPEAPANAATSADDGLPVRPGVYGNVGAEQNGIELQVHKLPRKLIEVTVCEQGCKPVRRVPYRIEGRAMTFGYTDAGETRTVSLLQQGDDVKAQGDGVGPDAALLKRLPKREALARAEEAVQRGSAR